MVIGRALSKTGITPNMISVLGVLISLLTAVLMGLGVKYIWPILVLLIISSSADLFDGMVARGSNRVTKFGAVLDHTLDRYVEAIIILGFILGEFISWFWGLIALVGITLPSSTKAKAELLDIGSTQKGIVERQHRQFILIAGTTLFAIFQNFTIPFIDYDSNSFPFIGIQDLSLIQITIALLAILAHITVIQRLVAARKEDITKSQTAT